MEPSKIIGGKEEEDCSGSNVSGWTMYIGSPVHDSYDDGDDDGHSINEHEDKKVSRVNDDNGDDDSDDSMASDASSWPSCHELSWGSSCQQSSFDKKHAVGVNKYGNKVDRPNTRKGGERIRSGKKAVSQAPTEGKVKKKNLKSK